MTEYRVVCGWCPMQLPDDYDEQWHHFLIEHNCICRSVRYYSAATFDEELAELNEQVHRG